MTWYWSPCDLFEFAKMKSFIQSVRLLIVLTVLTGVVYPLVITGIARLCFPFQAGGSLVKRGGRVVGSVLLAQKFASTRYFWPRPSACDFTTVPSGAGNLGGTSATLKQTIKERATALREKSAMPAEVIPPEEFLFASGSGLDPHVSPEAALFQVERVALARKLTSNQRARLKELVHENTEPPQFGFLGESRVNILLLNMTLDGL